MNYAQIRKMDISNGEYIGVSLFVSGCHFHCKNCFNSIAWDYNYGQRFTEDTMQTILQLLQRDFIKRFTILGGEPLDDDKVYGVTTVSFLLHGGDGLYMADDALSMTEYHDVNVIDAVLEHVAAETAAGRSLEYKKDGRVTIIM